MLYIDSSVMVAALTVEVSTARVQEWLAERDFGELCIADWTVTEVICALSMKLRLKEIDASEQGRALAAFETMRLTSLEIFPVDRGHFVQAAGFGLRTSLRAGDALHLAIASTNGVALYTLDKRLAAAGGQVGVPTHLIA